MFISSHLASHRMYMHGATKLHVYIRLEIWFTLHRQYQELESFLLIRISWAISHFGSDGYMAGTSIKPKYYRYILFLVIYRYCFKMKHTKAIDFVFLLFVVGYSCCCCCCFNFVLLFLCVRALRMCVTTVCPFIFYQTGIFNTI